MRIRSVRARLTLWYVSLLGATFLLLGGAAYLLLSYSLIRGVDSALESVARATAERVEARAGGPFPPEVGEIFRRFFGFSPPDPYFQMLDPGAPDRGPSRPRGGGNFPSARRPSGTLGRGGPPSRPWRRWSPTRSGS